MEISKNIEKIKEHFPSLRQLVMFYNDGIVFQTTFNENQDIPKLGMELANLLTLAQNLTKKLDNQNREYKKLIYEAENCILFIIKLGEDSNIALFLENIPSTDLKITPIRKYLQKLEELIDMEQSELN